MRLLVDFFQHEMLESALLSLYRVPGDPLNLRLDNISIEVCNADSLFCYYRDLSVAEKEHVSRILQDRRNVGGDKGFVIAQPNDNWRPLTNGNDRVGLVFRNY